MSTDTLAATEPVVQEETNPTAAIPEATETSTSNGVHSNGTNNNNDDTNNNNNSSSTEITEPVIEEQTELIKSTYDDSQQPSFNKNDLEPESLRKVFIGGLSYKTDDQAFRDYFSKFGDIVVSQALNIGTIASTRFD